MLRALLFLFLFFAVPAGAQALLAFEGRQHGKSILLSWTIGRGNTCQDLEIQHAGADRQFSRIYLYPGVCGNANFEQSFSWKHEQPLTDSTNHYRIVTTAGVLSDTIDVYFTSYNDQGYALVQLPGGQMQLLLDNPLNKKFTLELFDLDGKRANRLEGEGGSILLPRSAERPLLRLFRLEYEHGLALFGRVFLL